MLTVLSLGAGVQSTTVALLAKHGLVTPMPECAIFADTQAEPAAVYRHLDWLESALPFPVVRVTAGSLTDDVGSRSEKAQWDSMPLPAFAATKDGRSAPLNRSCTQDFKLLPIERELRRRLGIARKRSPATPVVEVWLGISADEASRMKPSRLPWMTRRWPLLEMRWSRNECLRWLREQGYPQPPRSACVFCPFHSDAKWQEMKENDPDGFAQAVAMDERIRGLRLNRAGALYLHRSMKPLAEIDFRRDKQIGLWDEECEGVCGV